jgi:hypothetical protein
MFATYIITSKVLGLVAAASAFAAQPEVAPATAGLAVATTEAVAATPTVRERRYCIKDRREGAPPRPKICRTRDDWRARGFDPLIALGRL